MFLPFFPPENKRLIPINSLQFKCLSTLATMMMPSTKTKDSILQISFHSESSLASEHNIEDPSTSSHHSSGSQPSDSRASNQQPTLRLPIPIVQLFIEHITQELIPIRAPSLSAVLSSGGCYSLDLEKLFEINNYDDSETEEILNTLARNCSYLRRLTLPDQFDVLSIFQGNELPELKCLKTCSIDAPEDLITVFAACPKLVTLDIFWSLNSTQSSAIFQELKKPTYNQIRHSLRELQLSTINIDQNSMLKLIILFPNLTKLSCDKFTELSVAIIRAHNFQLLGKNLHAELSAVRKILCQLKSLSVLRSLAMRIQLPQKIVILCPYLQELYLDFVFNQPLLAFIVLLLTDLDFLGNLKHLKRLSLRGPVVFDSSLDIVFPLLAQIGHNFEYLSLRDFGRINVPFVVRYCPNLKHLSIINPLHLSLERINQQIPMFAQDLENLKKPFTHLQTLQLGYFRQRSDNNAIPYILGNALNIEHIELSDCQITEKNLAVIIKKNPLTNLRVLIIRGKHSISKTFFDRLINRLPSLCYAAFTT